MAAYTLLIAHGKAYRLYEVMFKPIQQGAKSNSNGVCKIGQRGYFMLNLYCYYYLKSIYGSDDSV